MFCVFCFCLTFALTAVPLHHPRPPPRRLLRPQRLPPWQRLALSPLPAPHPGLPVPHQRCLGEHPGLRAASGGQRRRRRGGRRDSRTGRRECVQVSHGSVSASSAEARLHPRLHVRQLVAQMPLGCRDKRPHSAHRPGSTQSGSAQTDWQVSVRQGAHFFLLLVHTGAAVTKYTVHCCMQYELNWDTLHRDIAACTLALL